MTPRIYEIARVTLRRTPRGVIREETFLGRTESLPSAREIARQEDTLALVRALFGTRVLYDNGKEAACG